MKYPVMAMLANTRIVAGVEVYISRLYPDWCRRPGRASGLERVTARSGEVEGSWLACFCKHEGRRWLATVEAWRTVEFV